MRTQPELPNPKYDSSRPASWKPRCLKNSIVPKYAGPLTVPITSVLRAEFEKELLALRQQLVAVALGRLIPPAPQNENLCCNCPFAQPRRYRKGKSESVFAGVKAAVCGFQFGKGPVMHCDCGDRFRWFPPI